MLKCIKNFFLVSILLCSCARKESELNSFFRTNNLKLQLDDSFVIKSKSTLPRLVLAESRQNHELVKINVKAIKDKTNFLAEVKKTLFLIAAQFEFTMAPYPGQITEAVNCGTAYHPRLKIDSGLQFIQAFSNERLALSICEGDEYKYNISIAFFLDDKRDQLIIVEYYQDKSNSSRSADFLKKNFKNYKNVELTSFQNIIR